MLTRWICLLALCLALPARAAELKIDLGHGVTILTTDQLLHRADVRSVTIPGDVAYQRTMRYRAVPLAALLPGLAPGDHLQFAATDGFTAEIPAATILNSKGSQAWLAVENPASPWPALPGDRKGAGPFYLVWIHPQAERIGPEQWPYQLASIHLTSDMDARFPAIVPAASVPADSPIRRGFAVFKHTCFACHTLNGEGDATLGPDLNLPYNPTEYLRADLLRAFIRNPQSLHRWPGAKMHGFPTRKSLSDTDLDAVLDYLRYMARHKAPH